LILEVFKALEIQVQWKSISSLRFFEVEEIKLIFLSLLLLFQHSNSPKIEIRTPKKHEAIQIIAIDEKEIS
jgi:hypothetical protein